MGIPVALKMHLVTIGGRWKQQNNLTKREVKFLKLDFSFSQALPTREQKPAHHHQYSLSRQSWA
jgi:hypothetical protein